MQFIPVECVLREEAIVGESPVWCPAEKALYWVDITGQKIHRFHPASGVNDTFHLPEPVTALALRAKGGLVLSLKKDFALFDLESQQLTYLGDPEKDKPDNRFNDAKCDRQGRFWAGTMGNVHWDAPSGALYRLDADGTITLPSDGRDLCQRHGLESGQSHDVFHGELSLQRVRLRFRRRGRHALEPPRVRVARSEVGRLSGWAHGRRGGACVERAQRDRQSRPLYARRAKSNG